MRRQSVEQVTGLTTSTLYRLVKLGGFPAPLQLTKGVVAWKQQEVTQWIGSRPRVAL
ncbi:MAG: AlpA family phage regulatory protein [Paracoccaceae bacterium]